MLRMLKARLKTGDYYKMKTVPTVDEKEREISQHCLGLPTILREILRHLSTENLIKLSLVNKLWNFEARSVMKERRNLRAKISSDEDDEDDPCQKLVAFASDLANMRVIPFSGLLIDLHDRCGCRSISNRSLDPSCKLILNRLPWKHFSIRFRDDKCRHCANCPALQLVKNILEDFCWVLEELSLAYGTEGFYQRIFQDRRLPCLKVLKIRPGDLCTRDERMKSEFIKMLVSRAPNLQELHVDGDINFKDNVLQGSSAVLLPVHVFRPLFEHVCNDLIGSLRVNTMEILIRDVEELEREVLCVYLPRILQASSTTLKTLYTDIRFALSLISLGFSFENITTLQLVMNGWSPDTMTPFFLTLLAGMDFTPAFPKLNQVIVLDDAGQRRRYTWLKHAQDVPFTLRFILNKMRGN